MSELCMYLPTGGWARFACDVLWQSTLVGLIAWGVLRPLVRRPALRAWILLLALVCCVATPVGSAALRSGGYGLIARADLSAAEEIAEPQVSPTDTPIVLALSDRKDAGVATFVGGGAPLRAGVEKSVSWWTVVGIAWAAASTVLAVRLLLSLIGLWRLGRTATACADVRIVAAATEAARRVGLRKAPPVSVSPLVSSPTVLALGRPRLFIPPSGAQRCGQSDWCAVFCHELAHARRGDGWGRLLGELAVTLLPWQPLTWLLRRAYRQACDEACDDWAVAAGADPVELASTLTAWIPRRAPLLAVGVIGSSNVRARVLRLLSVRKRSRHRLSFMGRASSMVVVLILAASVAAAQVRPVEFTPKPPRQPMQPSDTKEQADQADRTAFKKTSLPAYRIEPPDVLQIELLMPVQKTPPRIREGDWLRIAASVPSAHLSIFGSFKVDSKGKVDLGTRQGPVTVLGLTPKQARETIKKHLAKALRAPEVVVLFNDTAATSINGAYLVGPDGTVNLRSHGIVHVAGKTVPEAEKAFEEHLAEFLLRPDVSLDVAAYNSKVYYVITQGAGIGDNVHRFPITGNETVLDTISAINGISRLSRKRIWIARPIGTGSTTKTQILPVDWEAISVRGAADTNYQIMPGDRLFIAEETQQKKSKDVSPGAAGTTDDSKQAQPFLKKVQPPLKR